MLCAPVAALAADAGFTDRIIVKYRNTSAVTAAAAQATQLRGTELSAARFGVSHEPRAHHGAGLAGAARSIAACRSAEAEQLARDIAASDPNVEYAEPDRIMRHTLTPNDTRYNEQWHYFEATGGINAPPAWDKSTGTGVVVAVIDTGYRPHADLAANILPGYDFIGDTFVANDGNGRDSDASDPGDWINAGECGPGDPATFEASSWHGTHVAGTIAARHQQRASAWRASRSTPGSCRRACSASAAATPPTSPTPSSGLRAARSPACRPTPTPPRCSTFRWAAAAAAAPPRRTRSTRRVRAARR